MRQGSVRGTVLKKTHGYRSYQTKKPRSQRQNFSSRNKFISSIKTLENTGNDVGLSVLRENRASRPGARTGAADMCRELATKNCPDGRSLVVYRVSRERSSNPAWVANFCRPPLASIPSLAEPSHTMTPISRSDVASEVGRASASASRIMAWTAAAYAASLSSPVLWRITRSPAASAAATNRSKTGPQSPGRSVTDVSRKRVGGNGSTIRRRRPNRSASSNATRSAPHAAEHTRASARSENRAASRLRTMGTFCSGKRGGSVSGASIRFRRGRSRNWFPG
jgi:hypothetical protein